MRSLVVASLTLLLLSFGAASASAEAIVGAPRTHGPDPVAMTAGPEVPAPTTGNAKPSLGLSPREAAAKQQLPSSWCGTERSTDDTSSELPNGEFRYHAVYMLPADGTNRFASVANTLQTDAFQASALLETSYGRAIRYDMGTNCGQQYLDISVVRMPQTRAQLATQAGTPTGTFDAVSDALNQAGFSTIRSTDTITEASRRTRNYVVWLDGPGPAGSCGQASIYDDPERGSDNLNNLGGKVAVVFTNQQGGFCSSNAARHEMGHNLGALQRYAPHAFDGSHCDDAYEDTMCYSQSPRVASGQRGLFFDYGNDDYWDAPGGQPLPWWTVNLNQFLCPDASCNMAYEDGEAVPSQPPSTGTSDADGDSVPDVSDNCPKVANADQENGYGGKSGDACEARSRARVKLRAKRQGRHGVWKVSLRATGKGRGVVIVRCRRRAHGQVRTVYSRTTRLPRTLRGRVRCGAGRPRARILVAN
jgi:hypothetical protein